MDEFDFIRKHLAAIAGEGAEDLEDDCAWLPIDDGWLVISKDTSIEGVHFPRSVQGAAATERAVRVAASDIAAKGADPVGMLVALTASNNADDVMMRAYALGMAEVSKVLGLPLLGGDTTRHSGPLSVTVTVIGKAKRKVLRSGARAGESLYLSSHIGSAALGLRLMMGDTIKVDGEAFMEWEDAFLRPKIDFDMGRQICEFASASLDCSDGLLADAANLANASNVRLEIEADAIPFSPATARYVSSGLDALQRLATAGDDYAILYTASEDAPVGRKIGRVMRGEGVALLLDGRDVTPDRLGYRH